MVDDSHWLNKFAIITDDNKRNIQFGLYAVATFGIGYAFRAIRPFKKFRTANQIPTHFIKKHLKLSGQVLKIEMGNPLLLRIDHKPIFLAKWRSQSDLGIGVQLANANVSSNGISWLHTILVGNHVNFTLLKRDKDFVICMVSYKNEDVAEQLISLGFATVEPFDFDLQGDQLYQKYYKKLLKLENKAEKCKQGIWDDGKFNLVTYIEETIKHIVYKIFTMWH